VTGPLELVLYAASSSWDTDFTVKLVDVFPAGYAMNLSEGIIRARYRVDDAQLARAVAQLNSVTSAWDARLQRIKRIAEAIQQTKNNEPHTKEK